MATNPGRGRPGMTAPTGARNNIPTISQYELDAHQLASSSQASQRAAPQSKIDEWAEFFSTTGLSDGTGQASKSVNPNALQQRSHLQHPSDYGYRGSADYDEASRRQTSSYQPDRARVQPSAVAQSSGQQPMIAKAQYESTSSVHQQLKQLSYQQQQQQQQLQQQQQQQQQSYQPPQQYPQQYSQASTALRQRQDGVPVGGRILDSASQDNVRPNASAPVQSYDNSFEHSRAHPVNRNVTPMNEYQSLNQASQYRQTPNSVGQLDYQTDRRPVQSNPMQQIAHTSSGMVPRQQQQIPSQQQASYRPVDSVTETQYRAEYHAPVRSEQFSREFGERDAYGSINGNGAYRSNGQPIARESMSVDSSGAYSSAHVPPKGQYNLSSHSDHYRPQFDDGNTFSTANSQQRRGVPQASEYSASQSTEYTTAGIPKLTIPDYSHRQSVYDPSRPQSNDYGQSTARPSARPEFGVPDDREYDPSAEYKGYNSRAGGASGSDNRSGSIPNVGSFDRSPATYKVDPNQTMYGRQHIAASAMSHAAVGGRAGDDAKAKVPEYYGQRSVPGNASTIPAQRANVDAPFRSYETMDGNQNFAPSTMSSSTSMATSAGTYRTKSASIAQPTASTLSARHVAASSLPARSVAVVESRSPYQTQLGGSASSGRFVTKGSSTNSLTTAPRTQHESSNIRSSRVVAHSRSHSRSPSPGRSSGRNDRASGNMRGRDREQTSNNTKKRGRPESNTRKRSPSRSYSPALDSSVPKNKAEKLISMPPTKLIEDFNMPSVSRHCHALAALDLYQKFPNLYVPADFVRAEIYWHDIQHHLQAESLFSLPTTAPVKLQATSPALVSATPPEQLVDQGNRATYILPSDTNSSLSHVCGIRNTFSPPKSSKFNARVIITFGMEDSESERQDSKFTRKLRVLCGRRKGNIILLGGAWNQELDGGNPLEDRRCLYNTARRTVLAQSLFDISVACHVVQLCEIYYQRPQEELRGKFFPEQDEITVLYLCIALPPVDMSPEEFAARWERYHARVTGLECGPSIHMDADTAASMIVRPNSAVAPNSVGNSCEGTCLPMDQEGQGEMKGDSEIIGCGNGAGEGAPMSIAARDDSSQTMDDSSSCEPVSIESAQASAVTQESNPTGEIESSVQEATVTDVARQDVILAADIDNDSSATSPTKNAAAPTSELKCQSPEAGSRKTDTTTGDVQPPNPCHLLCPQPIPNEVLNDQRKLEYVALRMLNLSTILSYTKDDVNERIFEASVAAELVRSVLAVSNADLIADFVLAEHGCRAHCAAPIIVEVTKELRRIESEFRKRKAQLSASQNTTKSDNLQQAVVETGDHSTTSMSVVTDVTDTVPPAASSEEVDSGVAEAKSEVGETAASDAVNIAVTEEVDPESSSKRMKLDNGEAVDVQPEEDAKDGTEVSSAPAPSDHLATEEVVSEKSSWISEEDARSYRRRFVSACRWFDVDQIHALTYEQLDLILRMSTRDISVADLTTILGEVCSQDLFLYESYI